MLLWWQWFFKWSLVRTHNWSWHVRQNGKVPQIRDEDVDNDVWLVLRPHQVNKDSNLSFHEHWWVARLSKKLKHLLGILVNEKPVHVKWLNSNSGQLIFSLVLLLRNQLCEVGGSFWKLGCFLPWVGLSFRFSLFLYCFTILLRVVLGAEALFFHLADEKTFRHQRGVTCKNQLFSIGLPWNKLR